MIKYWLHIQTSRNMILRQTFMAEVNNVCEHCFVAAIKTILRLWDKDIALHAPPRDKSEQQSFLSEIKIALINKYEEYFCGVLSNDQGISVKGGNKLRTYKIMKKYFRMEPYLKCQLPRKFVKSIVAFRLSTHKLEIEIGIYHKPTPRVCQQCVSGEVEDEVQFLFT